MREMMNYTWDRAERIKPGMIVYRPIVDSTIVWIEPAGHLYVKLHFADTSYIVVRADRPVMVQCCHRRQYEKSTHHRPIDAGVALLKVYRRRWGSKP